MRSQLKTLIVLAGLTFATNAPVFAQGGAEASDPLVGTWVLNLSKSTYTGAPAPKSERRNLDLTEGGMMLNTTEMVTQKGALSVSHYRTRFDGKEYPEFSRSSGSKVIAMLSFKRPDPNTVEVRVNSGGKPDAMTGVWKVSADGKTLTIDLKSTDEQGKPVHRIRVYEKQ